MSHDNGIEAAAEKETAATEANRLRGVPGEAGPEAQAPQNQTEVLLAYVRHHEVEERLMAGWVIDDFLAGTHHGRYSVGMRFVGK